MLLKKTSLKAFAALSAATVCACMFLFAACAEEKNAMTDLPPESEITSKITEAVSVTTKITEKVTSVSTVESVVDTRKTAGVIEYDGMTYDLDGNGTLIIKGNGKIDSAWKNFFNEDAVVAIDIEYGPTEIGSEAFSGCDSVETFFVPYGVTQIGSKAFSDCKILNMVDLSETVERVDEFAFSNCKLLDTIGISESVTSIDSSAFTSTDNVVIYGYAGSYAETFAMDKSIKFVSYDMDYPYNESEYYPPEESIPTVETSVTTAETSVTTVKTSVTSAAADGKSIADMKTTLSKTSFTYIGSAIKPDVKIEGLTKDKDYTVSYKNNINTGTGSVTVSGIGSYSGQRVLKFNIAVKKITSDDVKLSKTKCSYTGKAIKPTVTIKGLKENKDYTVTYSNNTSVSKASVTVLGKTNCSGTVTKTFEIVKTSGTSSIKGKAISVSTAAVTYTGKAIKPKVTINGLKEDVDFVVLYENNVNVGTATVKVAGIDKYTGTVEKKFSIKAKTLTQSDIKLSKTSYNYTGKEIAPEIKIGSLKKDKDFTVTYSNNIKAGTATITVTGIGSNVKGTIKTTFKIVSTTKSIEKLTINLSKSSFTYSGKENKPTVTIRELKENVDFVVLYENNINAGTGTVKVAGIDKYTGTVEKKFTINPRVLAQSDIKLSKSSYSYTGKEIAPEIKISGLKKDEDFSVSYSDNVDAGTAKITVTGIGGNAMGTVNATFTIVQTSKSIEKMTATLSKTTATYTGKEIQPKVTISGLKEGVDFAVIYENNVNAGTGIVKIAGIDKYSGTLEKKFTIRAKTLTATDIKLSKTSFYYTGEEITPEIKIGSFKQDEDFAVTYSNNVNAGTATITVKGIGGNVSGTAKKTFTIVQKTKSIETLTATLSKTTATYTGKEIRPKVTISGLTNKKDFVVEYSDNINVGTATVTITGKGNYEGVITKTFQIKAKNIQRSDVKLTESGFPYTGEEIEPEVTITGLEQDIDFTVTYSNNVDAGVGTVTVKGIGNCSGTVKVTFKIYPPSETIELS